MDPRKEKEKEDDLKLMKDPLLWHRWPMLPVKKMPDNGERQKFGFLIPQEPSVIKELGLHKSP